MQRRTQLALLMMKLTTVTWSTSKQKLEDQVEQGACQQ
ncbi:hypothetical protein A2U01_0090585, partial [Trifolium medium]|nr:hypothetical protein [Trifolium medium]